MKPLLKQFGSLTRADFTAHPVWIACHTADYDEPWYDDTDEETFRPWTGLLPADPVEGMLLMRATMILADGRSLVGFITPQSEGESLDMSTIQPQLFLPSGARIDFWDGMFKRSEEQRQILYSELGDNPSSIFPIHFHVDDHLVARPVSGSISGFCWCPNGSVEVYQ